MSPNPPMFFFFLALLLLISITPFTTSTCHLQSPTTTTTINNNNEDLINSTCQHTRYYELCMSSLLSEPKSRHADLPALAAISIDLAISHANSTLAYVGTLMKKLSYDAFSANCLDDCLDEYSDAIDNLREAGDAITTARGYNEVNAKVSGAMTDSDTCEDGFQDRKGQTSPLTERNEEFSKLCSNALAISALLGCS